MVIFCKNETNGKEIATKRNLKYHFLTLPAGTGNKNSPNKLF